MIVKYPVRYEERENILVDSDYKVIASIFRVVGETSEICVKKGYEIAIRLNSVNQLEKEIENLKKDLEYLRSKKK